ncbi:hypothetical protein [Xenorhabdus innexi]|uniref:Uncharacterized protein n=1 Tax=Xenorhabdus innexi TaxID=290109 RepID=A0A1N6MYX6_9GAMM|nr:hypothetical protein XIS1_490017 [Xenorhabdus innexi]
MEAVSPLTALSRGYNISETPDEKLLKQVKQLKVGDSLKTRL